MAGIKLSAPPVRVPMVDKNGNISPDWQRWFTLLHLKTGGSEVALPVALGGTGGTTVVEAIAVQTAASSSGTGGSGSNAITKRKTFDLLSPSDGAVSSITRCQWDTAFPDATYTVTAHFDGRNGEISVQDITVDGFSVVLNNTSGTKPASGSADCIGVHP